MTTTYDPHHSSYLDEADVRSEMTRVFDVCQGCRRCVTLCTSFPTLFEMIERHAGADGVNGLEAGRLTPAEQNQVVDECFQCTLCFAKCPYTPGQHELAIDVPRLMLRADAMQLEHGQVSTRERVATKVLARTDLIGKVASVAGPATEAVTGAKRNGLLRTALEKSIGVSRARLIPSFARQRFSAWFKRRPRVRMGSRQGRVALFPTCLVEYQQPTIGHDLVQVYERNGIEVSLADVGCCGAPWLHSGDRERFIAIATANVAALATEVHLGNQIVVPQPTCGYVIKQHYPDYVPTDAARLVAANTLDASEYLMQVHRDGETRLETDFEGPVPATIAYHVASHLRAQDIGLKSRDLMKLTGATIKVVQQSSGSEAMWGLHAANAGIALPMARRLGTAIQRAEGEIVAGDCHLSNTAITEQTGLVPVHPIQVLARAYGIAVEDPPR